jgi:phosphoglycerol transferase MdoB-like AlkP superfamily enzyme
MKKVKHNIYSALFLHVLLAFLLLHLSRYVFYIMNASHFSNLNFHDWINIIKGGIKFDVAAILYTNLIYILLQIIPTKFRYTKSYRKSSRIVYLVFNGLMLAFSTIDMIYFGFTLRRSTWMIFSEFSHDQNIVGIIFRAIFDFWYIIPIYLLFLIPLVLIYNSIERRIQEPVRLSYHKIGNVLFLVLIPSLIVGGVRGDFKYTTRPITMSNAGEYVKNPAFIPLVLNTPFCMFRTIQQEFYSKESFFKPEQIEHIYSPIQTVSTSQPFKYDNVVIIILESFGRESVGFYNKKIDGGKYKGYTPFLDSLLEEGLSLNHSFANGRKSIDALPSVLMGIPAGELPFVLTPYVSNKTESLPAILKAHGYNTSFFHGAPNGSMGFKALVNLIGIDHYYGKDEYDHDDDFDGTWGIWDEPFFQYFAHTVNEFKEPFMSTIFSVSSHEPFEVPSAYRGRFPKGDHPLREAIGYTDMSLRKFFDTAKKMPWFNHTLFVITGDHASISYQPEYKTALGEMTVPVLFYHPADSSVRKTGDKIVQQIDVMPTVLSHLHYDKPFVSFGRNVLSDSSNHFAVNYHNGFQLFQHQFMLQMNGSNPSALYDYVSDPLLKNNLLFKMPLLRDSMNKTVKAFMQQYHNRLIDDDLLAK